MPSGLSYNKTIQRQQGGLVQVFPTDTTLEIESGATLVLKDGSKLVQSIVTKAANYTVLVSESGTTFLANAVDLVFTLPATEAGLIYTFVTKAVSAVTGLQISPQAADAIHYVTSVDDKDLINTAATDVEGDAVTLIGDGAEGWWVVGAPQGVWAKQA